MKTFFILFALFTFICSAHAFQVHDIWNPETPTENHLILMQDGQIHELPSDQRSLLKKLSLAKENHLTVELTFDSDISKNSSEKSLRKKIIDVKVISVEETAQFDTNLDEKSLLGRRYIAPDPLENFRMSIINNMQDANYYFNSMNKNARIKSQCYNRAHVWTYELYDNFNISSTKFWLFFTKKYIKTFSYNWWFHVTPAVYVKDGHNNFTVMTMDRKYMNGPTDLTQWKNFFIQNRAHCPQVTQYSSYKGNQYKEYCFLIETSMYFWQPYQIENLESQRAPLRIHWLTKELDTAYQDGFGQ